MPRYFFDTTDAGVVTRDEIGIDLPDDAAARQHVGRLLPTPTGETLFDGKEHVYEREARNEAGLVIYRSTLTFNGQKI